MLIMAPSPKQLSFQVTAFHHLRGEALPFPQTRLGTLIEELTAPAVPCLPLLMCNYTCVFVLPPEAQTVSPTGVETCPFPSTSLDPTLSMIAWPSVSLC